MRKKELFGECVLSIMLLNIQFILGVSTIVPTKAVVEYVPVYVD